MDPLKLKLARALALIAGWFSVIGCLIAIPLTGLPFDSNRIGLDFAFLGMMAWNVLLILFGSGRIARTRYKSSRQ